jgi:hypothetical protein
MSMSTEPGRSSPGSVRERHDLIGSDRVEGTNVYRSNGDKIGEIERVMLEKVSGRAAYAVMSFGGFLGMGEEHYSHRDGAFPLGGGTTATRRAFSVGLQSTCKDATSPTPSDTSPSLTSGLPGRTNSNDSMGSTTS